MDKIIFLYLKAATLQFFFRLGKARNFDLRKKTILTLSLPQESLIIMKGHLQEHYKHRIAKSSIPLKEKKVIKDAITEIVDKVKKGNKLSSFLNLI
ncbi:hypothetical protein J2X97_001672 [Epilithonimonas hungarica]|uniref:hypothetical protein n=1 Tax=Epilithonimonas hungarica TaxID=454006 RepID=UPI00277F46D4|nr:hypothetical protein [Epilithonimonas hungarica]MDP9956035.1 hypothetical protein [Epilithonimonas hungarica]